MRSEPEVADVAAINEILLYAAVGVVIGWLIRPMTEQFIPQLSNYAMPQAPPQVLPAYPELIS